MPVFIWQCVLVALVACLGSLDVRFFGQTLFQEPLMLSVATGLVLGDVQTGLLIGVQLQIIFMGFVGIGYSVLPNVIAGSVLSTAFCIMTSIDVTGAIILAFPLAMLFGFLRKLGGKANDALIPHADAAAQAGDHKKLARVFWRGMLVAFFISFIPVFIAACFGGGLVESLFGVIPPFVMSALTKMVSIMPALGIGLMLNFITDKNTLPFVLLGFVLAAFMGVSTLAVAALSGVVALAYYTMTMRKSRMEEG